MRDLPPGPRESSIIQATRFLARPLEFLDACAQTYGDTFTLKLPGTPPLVLFTHPAEIRALFESPVTTAAAGQGNTPFLGAFLGRDSIFNVDGDAHRSLRRIFGSVFSGPELKKHSGIIRKIVQDAVARWPVDSFSAYEKMEEITLDSMIRILFGESRKRNLAIRRATLALTHSAGNPLRFVTSIVPNRLKLDALLRAEIERAGQPRTRTASGALAALHASIEADDPARVERRLLGQLLTLLTAGHDTTASTASWALWRILSDRKVAKKLADERKLVLRGGACTDEPIRDLEYLDATIMETLRLHPPLATANRMLTERTQLGRWQLPAGVIASPAIPLIHKRPDCWPNPESFLPERFLGERPAPEVYLPFGGSTRRCIGSEMARQEVAQILTHVLEHTTLRLQSGYRGATIRRGATLAPAQGVPITRLS